ncbi:MAG: urate hydroxylase PuuD [Mariprofundaceae bacterium]|nr:urate hydroxylase PuuD [Mariprofundaceae bacterium]
MSIFTNHKLALAAGFALAAVILGIGLAGGNGPDMGELIGGLSRWGHFLAGITWIGLLYYLNFCQVPSMGGLSADTKGELFKADSVVRRVMWWFRWGAMFTLIFGVILYMGMRAGGGTSGMPGWDIQIGALFGMIMWFNVWFIIWPAQKKILGIVEGASADEKAALGKRALIASRTNTILSIPMLLLMASSAHFRLLG